MSREGLVRKQLTQKTLELKTELSSFKRMKEETKL